MFKTLALLFTFIIFTSASIAKELPAYQIYNNKGKKVDYDKLLKACEEKKYVFFGELHNNTIAHWLQLELTKSLFAKHKKKLILGAEMFEADNQFILDEYLAEQISSKNFHDEIRLWPNYNTDYKPLVEFAKQNQLKFIASNVPRRYASMAYKKGISSLNELSELAKTFIAPLDKFEFDSTVACYRKMITEMGDHGGVSLATAQALKDATMAHFIRQSVTRSDQIMLHFNGAFHSNNNEGIIHYLKPHVDIEKILTITTVEQESIDELDEENKNLADFIICVPSNMTKTH
ncbi:ChaN family lipoprotein [Crocinitomix catalasitica]|uniref:ChaN family lipoprotein n=1 Tax=Crocinitomix catalasitica TaxID=184607 RepID=UPI000685F371|nr:ChaN family lipoprotein [Crocinitomix catalasitica]